MIQFTYKALLLLSDLRQLHDQADSELARAVVRNVRISVYQAARAFEHALGRDDHPLPLDERLRCFFEDPSGVRYWAIGPGFIFPQHVVLRGRSAFHVLSEVRIAAAYGMLDAAMRILETRFDLDAIDQDARAHAFERLRRIQHQMRHFGEEAGEEVRRLLHEPADVSEIETHNLKHVSAKVIELRRHLQEAHSPTPSAAEVAPKETEEQVG